MPRILLSALLLAALLAAAAQPGVAGPPPDPDAVSLVDAWRAAWQDGNPGAYASFYAVDFRSGPFDRRGWIEHKTRMMYRSGRIEVGIDGLRTRPLDDGRIEVTFRQRYRSALTRDLGEKTLVLVRTPEGLRIQREEWKPLPLEAALEEPGTETVGAVPPADAFIPTLAREAATAPSAPAPAPVPAAPPVPDFEPALAPAPVEAPPPAPPPAAGAGAAPAPGEKRVLEEIVARVNEQIITTSDVENRRRELILQRAEREQREPAQQMPLPGDPQIVDDLVVTMMLLQRAEDLGVNLDKVVDDYIRDWRAQNGIASDEEFDALLAQEGMSNAEYREYVRRTVIPSEMVYQEVGSRLSVTDEEVEQYYRDHESEFMESARVRMREIVLLFEPSTPEEQVLEAVRGLRDRILAGEDFAELARRFSDAPTAQSGGEVGTVHRGDMDPALEAAAFSLPVGAVSDPVRTRNGYHLLRVDERSGETVRPLDEVREKIRTELLNRRYDEKLREYYEKLRRNNSIEIQEKYRIGSGPSPAGGPRPGRLAA